MVSIKAKETFCYTKENIVLRECEPSKEDISQFREWLRKMPHLVQDYSDEFLIAFIKYGEGSLQKAKDCLANFNKIGMKFPELCGSLDPLHPQLQEHLSTVLIFPIPKKTDDNCTLFFFSKNPKCHDPTKFHLDECLRYYLVSTYVLYWVHIISSLDEIHVNNNARNILPNEYGGCEESAFVLHENWKKKVESYRERLLEEERKMKKLDQLRPKTEGKRWGFFVF